MKGGEAKKKKKKFFFFSFFFFCKIGNFLSGIGKKNILFGIWNGAEFRPQNRVIESPGYRQSIFHTYYIFLKYQAHFGNK